MRTLSKAVSKVKELSAGQRKTEGRLFANCSPWGWGQERSSLSLGWNVGSIVHVVMEIQNNSPKSTGIISSCGWMLNYIDSWLTFALHFVICKLLSPPYVTLGPPQCCWDCWLYIQMRKLRIRDIILLCTVSYRKWQSQDLNPVLSVPDSKIGMSLCHTAFCRSLWDPSTQYWAEVFILSDGMSHIKAPSSHRGECGCQSRCVWDEGGHICLPRMCSAWRKVLHKGGRGNRISIAWPWQMALCLFLTKHHLQTQTFLNLSKDTHRTMQIRQQYHWHGKNSNIILMALK